MPEMKGDGFDRDEKRSPKRHFDSEGITTDDLRLLGEKTT